MKFRPKNSKTGFTLVEIMIVVLIIGILLAIAIPNFVAARESSRAKACIGNLKQIDSATQQWAMDNRIDATKYAATPPTLDATAATGLVGANLYMRSAPACPSGGTEAVAAAITGVPTCTVPATNAADSNYTKTAAGVTGKFYHGL